MITKLGKELRASAQSDKAIMAQLKNMPTSENALRGDKPATTEGTKTLSTDTKQRYGDAE